MEKENIKKLNVDRNDCLIIGLTGLSGSGKSEITNYLEENNKYGIVRLGAAMRKRMEQEEFVGSVEEYAEKYRFISIAEDLIEEINQLRVTNRVIVIDSLRTVADYMFLKKYFTDFKLIMVLTNKEERIKRLKNRKRRGDGNSANKILSHDYWELSFGLDKLVGLVDKFIINDRSLGVVNKEIEQYIKCLICDN